MAKSNLKPCPFCGGTAKEEGGDLQAFISPFGNARGKFIAKWRVGCGICGVWISRDTFYNFDPVSQSLEISGDDGYGEVVRIWNGRAHET